MNNTNWNYVQPVQFENGLANIQASSKQGVNDALNAVSNYGNELAQKEKNRQAEAEYDVYRGMMDKQLENYRNAIAGYNEARNQANAEMRGFLDSQARASNVPDVNAILGEGNGLAKTIPLSADIKQRATQYLPYFQAASKQYGVPMDVLLAIAQTESGINPNVVSPTGVRGLMQVTQKTYNDLGFTGDRALPENSINAGAKLLSQLYGKYGNWEDAWYAYNGGHNGVTGVRNGDWGVWANNAGKQREITNYVPKVSKYRQNWIGFGA